MFWYTIKRPFGRDLTLICNDQDEVKRTVTGPDHEAKADAIAEDWNKDHAQENQADLGGEG